MSAPDYPAGTVAKATVRGVLDVTVMVDEDGDLWSAIEVEDCRLHIAKHVTDVRPLIVLDLKADNISADGIVAALRERHERALGDVPGETGWSKLADQIEAQTKPPRIPEPGLWGVVRDDSGHEWVRVGIDQTSQWEWLRTDEGNRADFRVIRHPVLVRDGIEDAS